MVCFKPHQFSGKIKKNKVVWRLQGIWFGYDLFHTERQVDRFVEYKRLIKKGKFAQADKLGGKLYGYPACCVNEFIKERKKSYIAKKYSYFEFYKHIRDSNVRFPFIFFH